MLPLKQLADHELIGRWVKVGDRKPFKVREIVFTPWGIAYVCGNGNAWKIEEVENMEESDREKLVDLTDELLMTDNLETIQEIAWSMKEILRQSDPQNSKDIKLFEYAKSLMYEEAERLGCL